MFLLNCGIPRNFIPGAGGGGGGGGGVCSTNSVEDRENVDLGAVAP